MSDLSPAKQPRARKPDPASENMVQLHIYDMQSAAEQVTALVTGIESILTVQRNTLSEIMGNDTVSNNELFGGLEVLLLMVRNHAEDIVKKGEDAATLSRVQHDLAASTLKP